MEPSQPVQDHTAPVRISDPLDRVRKMIQSCIQCGTCTGSCPNEFAMDITPRRMWRLTLMGKHTEIFSSKSFDLCSACYCCTLRCPRGLPLTDAMSALKEIAARENQHKYIKSIRFYRNFMDSVRRHGRVNEMEFMTRYFLSMKNPLLPFAFASLGIRLMIKNKVSFFSSENNSLDAVFRKAEEIENEKRNRAQNRK